MPIVRNWPKTCVLSSCLPVFIACLYLSAFVCVCVYIGMSHLLCTFILVSAVSLWLPRNQNSQLSLCFYGSKKYTCHVLGFFFFNLIFNMYYTVASREWKSREARNVVNKKVRIVTSVLHEMFWSYICSWSQK